MIGHQTNFHTSQKAPRYMQDSTLQHNGDNRWSRRAKSCNPIHFNNQRPPPIGIHDHGQISSWLVRCSKSTMPPPRGPRCRAWPMLEETFPMCSCLECLCWVWQPPPMIMLLRNFTWPRKKCHGPRNSAGDAIVPFSKFCNYHTTYPALCWEGGVIQHELKKDLIVLKCHFYYKFRF